MAHGTLRDINTLKRKDRLLRPGQQVERNTITQKSVETGTARFLQGRSTVRDTGRDTVSPETSRRFRESPGFFKTEDVGLSTPELLKRERGKVDVGVKPVVRGGRVGGIVRPTEEVSPVPTTIAQKDPLKLKPGESIGRFAIGTTTAEQENARLLGRQRVGKPGVFTAKGIEALFEKAANLAEIFASPEFQQRKAKGIRGAAQARGAKADVKAKTDRIKALGTVVENLATTGGNEELIVRLQEEIGNLIDGKERGTLSNSNIGIASRFKQSGFTDKEIKSILGRL